MLSVRLTLPRKILDQVVYREIEALDPGILWEVFVQYRLYLIPVPALDLLLLCVNVLWIEVSFRVQDAKSVHVELPLTRVFDWGYGDWPVVDFMVRTSRPVDTVDGEVGAESLFCLEDWTPG